MTTAAIVVGIVAYFVVGLYVARATYRHLDPPRRVDDDEVVMSVVCGVVWPVVLSLYLASTSLAKWVRS